MSDYDEPLSTEITVAPIGVPTPAPVVAPIDYSTVEKGPDGVVFVIGKERVVVPPLTFWSLSRCASEFQTASDATTMIERVGGVLKVLASSLALSDWRKQERARLLSETESIPWVFDQLCKMLRGNEWMELSKAYGVLLVESGLLDGDAFYGVAGSSPSSAGTGETPKGEGPDQALSSRSSSDKVEASPSSTPVANGLVTLQ